MLFGGGGGGMSRNKHCMTTQRTTVKETMVSENIYRFDNLAILAENFF